MIAEGIVCEAQGAEGRIVTERLTKRLHGKREAQLPGGGDRCGQQRADTDAVTEDCGLGLLRCSTDTVVAEVNASERGIAGEATGDGARTPPAADAAAAQVERRDARVGGEGFAQIVDCG